MSRFDRVSPYRFLEEGSGVFAPFRGYFLVLHPADSSVSAKPAPWRDLHLPDGGLVNPARHQFITTGAGWGIENGEW